MIVVQHIDCVNGENGNLVEISPITLNNSYTLVKQTAKNEQEKTSKEVQEQDKNR